MEWWPEFAVSSLRDRLAEVRGRVQLAAERAHRSADEIRIVAVSKTVAAETVAEAFRLGQRDFGENRVQEVHDKRAILDAAGVLPTWHMVGHLQSNKAKLAVGLFDIIQSVGSLALAQTLERCAAGSGRKARVLLQVDFTHDPGRSGFKPDELDASASDLVSLPDLEIQGLMTVAPLELDEAGLRAVFGSLRAQRDRLSARYPGVDWHHLSMGMSDDFELAVEEGATIVRIGRAIFGERPQF